MTTISHNLVGKIDEKTVAILADINSIIRRLALSFFVVGATARDILLEHAYGITSVRATLDIDIGVFVSGWDQFQAMKVALEASGKFRLTRNVQRLIYGGKVFLDIVPFGGVADADGSISWPPGHDTEMSVLGFGECYEHAVSVQVDANPDLVVKVVSLAGLAILKLVAWEDNAERRGKDAVDLYLIMKKYPEAGNLDRFCAEGLILEAEKVDYDRASARFLGREISRMAERSTVERLVGILKREAASPNGHQIAMNVMGRDALRQESYEKVVENFNALLRGLLDPAH